MLELLLANHPLDCPVCDKGGECPLQDQAFSHGPGESRYVEEKRHFEKPIPISDLVLLDRERCILCDRCTRFANEVAGDPLIHFISRGNDTQVMTFPDEPFASVLHRQHRADLPGRRAHRHAVPVQGPAVGPRAGREHVHDVLRRLPHHRPVEPRRAAALPGRRQRPGQLGLAVRPGPVRLRGGQLRPAPRRPAGARRVGPRRDVVERRARDRRRARPGGPRRRRCGRDRRARRCTGHERGRLRVGQARRRRIGAVQRRRPARRRPAGRGARTDRATIDEAADAATIVLLGPDLKEELPVLYLRLRDAAEKRRSRILEISPTESGLTNVAWKSVRYEPGGQLASSVRRCPSRRSTEQLAKGNVVVVAGRATSPSRRRRLSPRWRRCSTPSPAPRCFPPCGGATCSAPSSSGSGHRPTMAATPTVTTMGMALS